MHTTPPFTLFPGSRNWKSAALAAVLFLAGLSLSGQSADSLQIRKIFDESLLRGRSYDWLNHLSNQIGGRLSGSVQAKQAVEYTKKELEALGLDRVWLQPVMVPKWVRGTSEFAYIESEPGNTNNVPICALGGSVATPVGGIKAGVVEVQGIEQLQQLDREEVEGKIVFFNLSLIHI